MIKLSNIFKHLNKILTHKRWVFHYARKSGIWWRGLTHDLSKFSPIEFWESVKFYQGTSSPIPVAKQLQGYSRAWQHHKGHNPHHYEYWTDNYEKGITAIRMPYKYAVEMLCDYLGAARAYMGSEFSYVKEYYWWRKKRNEVKMHEDTIMFVDIMMDLLRSYGEEELNKKNLMEAWSYPDNVNYLAAKDS